MEKQFRSGDMKNVSDNRENAHPEAVVDPGVIKRIVQDALSAPSPDNNQPWHVQEIDSGVAVFYQKEEAIEEDPKDILNYIGLGALIESLTLAAANHAVESEVRYFPNPEYPLLIATLHFKGHRQPAILGAFLNERHTNRNFYSKEPVFDWHRKALEETAERSECMLSIVTTRTEIKRVAKQLCKLDGMRMRYEPFHSSLYSCLRFSSAPAHTIQDGLPLSTLALPPGGAALLRLGKSWRMQQRLNSLGLAALVSLQMYKTMLQSGAIGVITIHEDSKKAFLEAGRTVQRVWLRATELKLQVHPLAVYPVMHSLADGSETILDPSDREIVKETDTLMARIFNLEPASVPVMVFRLGYGKNATQRSGRKDLREVFTSKAE